MPHRTAELEKLQADLRAAREAVEEKVRVDALLDARVRRLQLAASWIPQLTERARDEEEDVDRLEAGSLSAWFLRLLGKHAARLDEERRELVAARLRLEHLQAEVSAIEAEIAGLRERHRALEGAPAAYQAAWAATERWLCEHDEETAKRLFSLAEEQAVRAEEARELEEALLAARRAGEALAALGRVLTGARSWGTLDLLGGGALTSLAKQDRLDEAHRLATAAELALARLQDECRDVDVHVLLPRLRPETAGRIVDVVFDNVFTDWAVQGQIAHAEAALEAARSGVARVVAHLGARASTAAARLRDLGTERARLVTG